MERLPNRFYEFASFRVDAAERQLTRHGEIVPLTSKVFDVLLTLVENSGQTVEKDELMQKVWADTFVEEGNLNRNISTLRKVLGDDSHQQRFIKTVPKRGYRFTADVREILEKEEALLVENKSSYQLKIWEEVREEKFKLSHPQVFIVSAFLILVGLAVAAWVWNKPEEIRATSIENADASEAMELYRRGRELWQTRNAEHLHKATTLLEQSVQKNPNFAPAHAALADAYAFDYRLWQKAEPQAREAIRLDANLGEAHATIGFVKMFWEWKISEAESEFKEAVRLSPNYATARQWYSLNLWANGNAGSAAYVEMKKALELAPDSLSINADMCQTLYFLRRFDEAVEQCEKTLRLNEKSYNAYTYLYEIYTAKGMEKEAVETFFIADSLNSKPSPPAKLEKIRQAYLTGGIRAFWKARIETMPYSVPLHYRIAQHYALLGDKTQALSHLEKAFETRDFEFIYFLVDPVFDGLRFEPRYINLQRLFLN